MALQTSLKTAAQAAIVALTIAGVATPTFAAPPPPPPHNNPMPSFNFNFGFDVPGFRFGFGNKVCLTDRQIVRELRSRGYTRISIISHGNRHNNRRDWVKVSARRDGHTYVFYVDACRGNIGFW